jgi:hypothetical protein
MNLTRQRAPVSPRDKRENFKFRFLMEVRQAYLDENPGALLDQVLSGFSVEQKTLHLLQFVQNQENLLHLGEYLTKSGRSTGGRKNTMTIEEFVASEGQRMPTEEDVPEITASVTIDDNFSTYDQNIPLNRINTGEATIATISSVKPDCKDLSTDMLKPFIGVEAPIKNGIQTGGDKRANMTTLTID